MGKRTAYEPGAFCWVDLETPDIAGAAAFYTALFGWDADEGSDGYVTFRLDGESVCGLRAGEGTRWENYVSVVDAGATATRAGELGGKIVAGPFDAGSGDGAILADPQGATFALWQPGTHFGAQHVNDVGCLCMNELVTSDLDGARAFYESLFGWRTETVDTGPDGPPMVAAFNGDTLNASLGVDDGPAQWRPYFTVVSTEAALTRVHDLGGQTLFGPFPIPDGSIAGALDPQGAVFALFEGEVDP